MGHIGSATRVRICPTCRGTAPEGAASCPLCGQAFAATRFKLHPSTPDDAVDRPRAPPAPPAQTPSAADRVAPMRAPSTPPAAPARAPVRQVTRAPAKKAPNRRTLVLLGVVLLAALIVGGVLYYSLSPEAQYPERYLLSSKETPSALTFGALTGDARSQAGTSDNPRALKESELDQLGRFTGARPEEGWVQILARGDRSDAVSVVALRFVDTDDADQWVKTARAQCGNGASHLMQHGAVVVLVIGKDEQEAVHVEAVTERIEEKSPRLERQC